MNSFFVRHGSTDSETGPRDKRPRREVIPDSAFILEVLMEGRSGRGERLHHDCDEPGPVHGHLPSDSVSETPVPASRGVEHPPGVGAGPAPLRPRAHREEGARRHTACGNEVRRLPKKL
ncbi:hypothetical protein AVEN_24612-1 [Araneus ventricosus]|uniref:Uncharacterized protein n=1 Tax=Araneus ventricosus TaxID=182803 RepID=A0A4Y2IJV9_ARAVE|nr:hypothetical protein AVEN_24612-1 [Araneus ventricosus]